MLLDSADHGVSLEYECILRAGRQRDLLASFTLHCEPNELFYLIEANGKLGRIGYGTHRRVCTKLYEGSDVPGGAIGANVTTYRAFDLNASRSKCLIM